MTSEDCDSESFWLSEIDKCPSPRLSLNRNKTKLSLSPSNGANRRRKGQSVSNNLQKAKEKGKKKRRCSAESSASQQPEPKRKKKSLEELMEESVPNAVKALKNRAYRRINNMSDMKLLKLVSEVTGVELDLIQRKWPVWSAFENVKKEIKEISEEIKEIKDNGMEVTDKIKQRLLQKEKDIEKLDNQRREFSRKVDDLVEVFTTEGISSETQREKLFAAFPRLPGVEIETNGPTAEQDQGRSPATREKLLNEIVAENNNEVHVSEFPLLKEAMEKTTDQWNVPDYLKLIANRIEDARGTATDFAHFNIQLLVCAAIQEMEDLPLGFLDPPKLLKWGAALNKAMQLGFRVEFAENLFWKNVYAYFAFSNIG